MARHSSANLRNQKSTHEEPTPDKQTSTAYEETSTREVRASRSSADGTSAVPVTIDASLKRRARLLITNSSIPKQTRELIRYALDIRDPYLAQIVSRVEAGEMTIDHVYP